MTLIEQLRAYIDWDDDMEDHRQIRELMHAGADRIAALEARCRQQDEEIARLNEWYDKHQESIAELKAALRRADDIEHSISAEDWYKQRDALLGSSNDGEVK